MNPSEFTLRELLAMTEAREKTEWNRTACVLALMANLNRDPRKQRAMKPEEFNPYSMGERRKPVMKAPLELLRDLWCRPKGGD